HVNRHMAENGVPEFVERDAGFSPAAAQCRLRKPLIELRERICVQVRAIQAAERVFPSDVRHAHNRTNLTTPAPSCPRLQNHLRWALLLRASRQLSGDKDRRPKTET